MRVVLSFVSLAFACACGSRSLLSELATDAAASDAAPDAAAVAPPAALTACDARPSPDAAAHVRLASRSPDAPPLELCAAHDVVQFASMAPLFDAGVASGETSAYVEIARGSYFVRLVAQGAGDCGRAVGPVFGGPVLAGDGGFFTVTATGALDRDGGASPLSMEVSEDAPPSDACAP